jgi:ABC-type branched-subunit amino acid transport system substrate-binding protein
MALLCVTSLSPAWAWTDPLSPEERRGRTIYHRGVVEGEPAIRVTLHGADQPMSATLFRCAQCHGAYGEGSQEGGLRVPSLTPSLLANHRVSAMTGHRRDPYTNQTLARAITQGLDASSSPLHTSMPRYQMTLSQADALVAYLRKIGEDIDTDPGIDATTITIGTALPLSGPFAQIGHDAHAILLGYFARINKQGGIYGRQATLIAEDSQGNPAQGTVATRRLLDDHHVFAVIASFEAMNHGATHQLLHDRGVPLIGPLTLSPQLTDPPNRYVFYALPGFGLQFRALLDVFKARAHALTGTSNPRLAVIHAKSPYNEDALRGVLAQAQRHSLKLALDHSYRPGQLNVESLVKELTQKKIDAVVFLGEGEDLVSLGNELDRRDRFPALLSAVGMSGARAHALPPRVRSRLLLASPLSLSTKQDMAQIKELAPNADISSPGFARMAHTAASILGEALMRTGRRLSHDAVIEALETFRNVDAGTGVPLTYGAHQRLGTFRSTIVGLTGEPPSFVLLADGVVPEGPP